MISVHPYRCKTWSEAKREWGWLMRSKGLQQINRNAPTGYGEAPDLSRARSRARLCHLPARLRPARSHPHHNHAVAHLRQSLLWNFKPLLMKPVNTKSLFHVLCATLEKLDSAEINVNQAQRHGQAGRTMHEPAQLRAEACRADDQRRLPSCSPELWRARTLIVYRNEDGAHIPRRVLGGA